MVNEKDKYRAQYFQIGSLSCMAPFGKIILDIKDMEISSFNFFFIAHILISLLLFYFGIILLIKGFESFETE